VEDLSFREAEGWSLFTVLPSCRPVDLDVEWVPGAAEMVLGLAKPGKNMVSDNKSP
jgi:hypothetical protein